MIAAGVSGYVGFLIGAIFVPLLFPLSLTDPDRTENMAFLVFLMLILLFAVVGVTLCWKITGRRLKDQ
jgi:hypothetical protein